MASIRETWDDCGLSLKRSVCASLLLGTGIFIVGLCGDIFAWWRTLNVSFLPNALMGLSSFFIGAPVALVFLNTLDAQREQRKLEKLSDSAWKQFADHVDRFCAGERVATMRGACQTLGTLYASISAALHFPQAHAAGTTQNEITAHYADIIPQFASWADEIEAGLDNLRGLLPSTDKTDLEWTAIQTSWSLLETYVKVQRFEMQLEPVWLETDSESNIRSRVVVHGNAARNLYGQTESMANLPAYLRKWATIEPEKFWNSVPMNQHSNLYRGLPRTDYADIARWTADALEALQGDVRSVEVANGWPPQCTSD
jgi:hypothetical protein